MNEITKEIFEIIFKFMFGLKKLCKQKDLDIGIIENYRKGDYIIEFHLSFEQGNFKINDYASLIFGKSFDENDKYDFITYHDIDNVVGEIDEFINKVNSIQGLNLRTLTDYVGELEE